MRAAVRRPAAAAAAQLFCLFFLFFKIFFRFSSLCVLFQSPTHDLTSLVVCLSSALLFCFVFLPRESPNERTNGVDNKTHSSSGSGGIYYKRPEAGYVVGFFSFFTGRYSFLHWLVVFGFGFFLGCLSVDGFSFPRSVCQLSSVHGVDSKGKWFEIIVRRHPADSAVRVWPTRNRRPRGLCLLHFRLLLLLPE